VRVLATWLFAFAACAPDRALVFPPPPEPANTGALVLALENGQGLSLWAADPSDQAFRPSFQFERGKAARLFWIRLAEPLTSLGLTPGPLEPAPSGSIQHLPAPSSEVWSIAWDGSTRGEWHQEAGLTDSLRSFPLPATNDADPCVSFTATPVTLGPSGGTSLMVPLGPDALLLDVGGTLGAVKLDGTFLTVTTTGASLLAGLSAPDGTLWLSSSEGLHLGRVVDLHLELQLLARAPLLQAIARSPDGVIFVASPSDLYRYTAQAGLQHLAVIDPPFPAGYQIAALGPDEVVLVGERQGSIRRYTAGTLMADPAPPRIGEPQMVVEVPGVGTVVGTSDGVVLLHQGSSWAVLPGNMQVSQDISVGLPYRGGFLVGGAHGSLVQWRPRGGFCGPQVFGTINIHRLAALPDRVALGLGAQTDGASAMMIFIQASP
jgi:hypothetical protein